MNHEEPHKKPEAMARPAPSGKLPWSTPCLAVHGDIHELTGKMFGGSDLSGVLDPFASDS